MTFRVVLSPNARRELYEDALWWAEHRDTSQAVDWLHGFELALQTLANHPETLPFAKENGRFPFELRQLLYGLNKRPTHRAVFEIRGSDVIVHGIRHLARQDLQAEDLDG